MRSLQIALVELFWISSSEQETMTPALRNAYTLHILTNRIVLSTFT